MKNRLKYILSEAKVILLCAAMAAMAVTWLTVGYWWFEPQTVVLVIVGCTFVLALLLGIFASLHDDYKLCVKVERRHK